MKQNIGNFDRVIRLLIVVVIGILYLTGSITGTVATILLIIALVLAFVSLIKFCPLYAICKISTCKTPDNREKD